ncbi:transposase [Streptomyces sp. NBC_01236]|uniref:transposase n=1 Tax=Streptomyces sp. NBC_01236 TaxID=2903789 RepID=UPI003FA39661
MKARPIRNPGRRSSSAGARDAVQLVLSNGRSIGSVTKELGVSTESLRQWVRRTQPAIGGDSDAMTPGTVTWASTTKGANRPTTWRRSW